MFLWTPTRSYQLHGLVLPTWTGRYKSTPIPKLNRLGGTSFARAPFAEPTDFASNISSSIFVIFQSRKTCYRKRIGFYANKERAAAGHHTAIHHHHQDPRVNTFSSPSIPPDNNAPLPGNGVLRRSS